MTIIRFGLGFLYLWCRSFVSVRWKTDRSAIKAPGSHSIVAIQKTTMKCDAYFMISHTRVMNCLGSNQYTGKPQMSHLNQISRSVKLRMIRVDIYFNVFPSNRFRWRYVTLYLFPECLFRAENRSVSFVELWFRKPFLILPVLLCKWNAMMIELQLCGFEYAHFDPRAINWMDELGQCHDSAIIDSLHVERRMLSHVYQILASVCALENQQAGTCQLFN